MTMVSLGRFLFPSDLGLEACWVGETSWDSKEWISFEGARSASAMGDTESLRKGVGFCAREIGLGLWLDAKG